VPLILSAQLKAGVIIENEGVCISGKGAWR